MAICYKIDLKNIFALHAIVILAHITVSKSSINNANSVLSPLLALLSYQRALHISLSSAYTYRIQEISIINLYGPLLPQTTDSVWALILCAKTCRSFLFYLFSKLQNETSYLQAVYLNMYFAITYTYYYKVRRQTAMIL